MAQQRWPWIVLGVIALAPTPAVAAADVLTAAVRGGAITGLAWDPAHGETVWAGVHGAGLYRSSNGGATWTQILLPTVSSHFASAVLPSTAATDLVFVCEPSPSEAAIWRSADGAATFANVLPTTTGACTTIIDGRQSGTLYAGVQVGSNAKVYRSLDSGQTWSPLGLDQPTRIVSSLLALGSGRLVAGLRDGAGGIKGKDNTGAIFYSDDDGASWMEAPSTGTNAVAKLASSSGGHVMALTTNGATAAILNSTDGAAWSAGPTFPGSDQGGHLEYHAASDTFFVMATNDTILQSTAEAGGYSFAGASDKAATAAAPVPLSVGHHSFFTVDPSDAAHLLLGDFGGGEGIFATANGGADWTVSNDGLYAQEVNLALKSPGGRRYAANTTGFVYFSAAAIDSAWKRIYRASDVTHDPVQALAYDMANDARVVIAQSNLNDYNTLRLLPDAVSASEDAPPYAHAAWQTLTYPNGSPGTPVLALLVDGMTMYAGTANKQSDAVGQYLYKSIDGGVSWSATSLQAIGGIRALAFDPSNHQTLYAGAGDYAGGRNEVMNAGGLWKSTDGGQTWSQLSSNATLNSQAPRTIVVDPTSSMRLWVFADKTGGGGGNTNNDLFESLDGGASWAVITPSNVGASRFAFTYSPGEGLLALATGGSGINVYTKTPGNGSSLWDAAFGVYGEGHVLYAGSIGVGTATGLFEATGVTIGGADMASPRDLGTNAPDLYQMPVGGKDGGGCSYSPAASPDWEAVRWIALLVAVMIASNRVTRCSRRSSTSATRDGLGGSAVSRRSARAWAATRSGR